MPGKQVSGSYLCDVTVTLQVIADDHSSGQGTDTRDYGVSIVGAQGSKKAVLHTTNKNDL